MRRKQNLNINYKSNRNSVFGEKTKWEFNTAIQPNKVFLVSPIMEMLIFSSVRYKLAR